jgi:PAS domain S-box-containing protein
VIIGWSDDAAALYGWTREEAIGMRSHLLVPERNRRRYDDFLARLTRDLHDLRTVERRVFTALHRDGRELPVEVSITIEGEGDALRLAAVVRNATPGRAARILVAEDNLVNQRVAAAMLTKRGHSVTVVNNGREAVAALKREPFDLVLMDVQMPEMDGFEATAAIRLLEEDTGRRVRIVAMTAHAMSGDRERCLAAGMDGYLSKPIDQRSLFAAVER